jgi:hypothetical protein
MQGNGAAAGAMAVGPTPAGHQAELNIIYSMVEDLSRQLSDNRHVTEQIVSGLGRVRNRARERGLGNEDLLGEAADELFGTPFCLFVFALLLFTWSLSRNGRS